MVGGRTRPGRAESRTTGPLSGTATSCPTTPSLYTATLAKQLDLNRRDGFAKLGRPGDLDVTTVAMLRYLDNNRNFSDRAEPNCR